MVISLYFPVTLLSLIIRWVSLFQEPEREKPFVLNGLTMGTTWQVIYFDDRNRDFSTAIDSLLELVNQSINHYDPASEVSEFNSAQESILSGPFFRTPLEKGREVFVASDGAFDMTVMPLVNAWGFGPGKQLQLTPLQIDSLKAFVGFEKIRLEGAEISKSDPRVQLDFGGIGQGYAVDVISRHLRQQGVDNLLVELGGEGFAAGKNLQFDRPWQIGILDPESTREDQTFKLYLRIDDRAFTTSGNYFNYRIVDGKKYGHTFDPRTGYPVRTDILSASVFAADCMTADAWATAFMVMGLEAVKKFLTNRDDLDAIIFYAGDTGAVETFMTNRIKSFVISEETRP